MAHRILNETPKTEYDVVTLGETMLRWTPPNLQRFEQASSMEVHVGGSESNTAVGLAKLGLKVAWLSRLTKNPLGKMIENTIRHHGVDTAHVCWTNEDRVGLYFLEEGREPRGSQVIYDRKDSAASRMVPQELPTELFQSGKAKLFHTTGITAAISKESHKTALEACNLAKAAGWQVSFDLNYRAKLWKPEEAKLGCEPFMKLADILFVPARDATMLFEIGDSPNPNQIAKRLGELFPQAIVVLTLGEQGSMALADGVIHKQSIFPADRIGRLGGGDAFSAGFLFAHLAGKEVIDCLKWGAAAASFKYSIPGDLPLIDYQEIVNLVYRGTSSSLNR